MLTALVLATVLAGTDADGAWPGVIEPQAPTKIQQLLDRHLASLAHRDVIAYGQTFDGRSTALAVCMRQFFDIAELRTQALRPNRLRSLEQVSPTLARGFVEQRYGLVPYYFRSTRTDGWSGSLVTGPVRWSVSQPNAAEAGAQRVRTAPSVTVSYWEIDDYLSKLIASEAASALREAMHHLPPSVGEPSVNVRLIPRRDLSDTRRTCLVAGAYDRPNDEILIYRVALQATGSLSRSTRQMIRHEVLHWVQWRRTNVSAVDWWLREGWPQHVVGEDVDTELLAKHICRGAAQGVKLTDLQHGPPAERPSGERALLLYAVARSLTTFTYELGKMDDGAYWRLVSMLSEGQPRAAAYETVLGISLERLRELWQDHAERLYC